MVQLGDLAKDKITGFEGIAMSITSYYNNCDRVGLQPRELSKDGYVRSREFFDVTQVEVVEKGVVAPEPTVANPFKFLDEVRCTVTGFKGKVVAMTAWLNGCMRIGVQSPEFKDGHPIDDLSLPAQQLEMVVEAPKEEKAVKRGGPMKAPGTVRDPQ